MRSGAEARLGPTVRARYPVTVRFRSRHAPLALLASSLAGACGTASSDDERSASESTSTGSATTDGGSSESGAAATDASTGGTTSATTEEGTDGGSGEDTGEPGILVGSFLLQLAEPTPPEDGSTSLFGKIHDGPSPELIVWELAATEGECSLVTPRVPFCTLSCGNDAACVEDETCAPYPESLEAGDIAVDGVGTMDGATMFTMTPVAENYQPPAGTLLAYPGVVEGAAITLSAAGGAVEAFELDAPGVAPLLLDNDDIMLDPELDLVLGWAPAAEPTASRVHVELDVSHHGGTKGKIECEIDDAGELTIASTLVASLLELGVAGFPSIVVRRESTGWTNVAVGRIDLVVSSHVERIVSIEGLTSCSSDDDCPDGQTCQTDLTCS